MICYTKAISKNDIRKWEIDEHVPNWSYVYGPMTTGVMKFRIYDAEKTSIIEVWAMADDNSPIFEKIFNNNVSPERMIFVKAKIEGIDIPMEKGCERWIRLIIKSEKDIFFASF